MFKNKIVFKCIIEGNSEIFIMNEDGSGQKNLTNSPNLDHQPSLSPDSEKIVYVSRETKYGDGDIWTMNPDGSEKKRLKKRIVDKHLPPLWSSDGNKIVFISREDIWTMNPDGSRKKRLTNNKKK